MVPFAFLTCLFSALFIAVLPAQSETWRIAALEWPPYASPDIPDGGIAVAALRKTLAKADIELQVEYMPWTRAQALARTGAYAGYFPAWPEEVQIGFKGSLPLVMSKVGVVQRKDKPINWTDVSNLFERNRVGFVNTYVYPHDIQIQINNVLGANPGAENERDLTRTLSAGRVDLAITDPNVMLYFARELGVDNLEANPKTIAEKALVLAMPNQPAFKARRDLLNKLIDQETNKSACGTQVALLTRSTGDYCPSK